MAELDLISMADIARLAGQSRATVGNWKARNPDFPAERGRGPRGPLYDRTEATRWLEARGRLDKRPQEVAVMWDVADQLRGDMTIDDALSFVLVLLAVISGSSPADRQRIRQAAPQDLDKLLRSTTLALFPFAEDLMPRRPINPGSLQRVINLLSKFDPSNVPLMADTLLEQAATAMRHRSGEYLTPPSVRRLLVSIAQPTGTVYNPASGIGQLLADAAASAGSGGVELYGQEINPSIWAMARLNLAIHDVRAEIALGDVFRQDHYPQLRADRVIAVPPWNQKLPVLEHMPGDPRWIWGEPGPHDGNAAWIQHCLYHLAEEGRAVIVLPNGVLFERGRAGLIRQRIVKAGLLDAVVALPPGLFAWTNLPCAVLVFANRTNAQGWPSPTLMVDLRESGEGRTARSATLSDELIGQVARLYCDWADGVEPTTENAVIARFDDLAANEFVIDPGRYVSLPTATQDLGAAISRRSELLRRLQGLSLASLDTDDQLHLNLEGPPVTAFNEVRLGDLEGVLTVSKGFPTQRATPDGEVRVLSLAALRNEAPPKWFADPDDIRDAGAELAQPGDVLVAVEGGTVGETMVVPSGLDDFVPSQQVATVRVVDTAQLDPWFLGAWFTTEPAREQVRRLARGTAIQRVPIHDLASITIQLPSLAAQQEIGRRFRAFDNAIQAHREITACMQELRDMDLVVAFAGASTGHLPDQHREHRGDQGAATRT